MKNKQEMEQFYTQIKESLLSSKVAIIHNLEEDIADFVESSEHTTDLNDSADLAADDMHKLLLKALETENNMALLRINAALSRLENGTYGICRQCGATIDHERLLAMPEAILCISCKSQSEKNKLLSEL
jgi:DnaK suppressor protein